MARGRTGKRGSAGKRRTQQKRMTKRILTGGTNSTAPKPPKKGWSFFKSKPTMEPTQPEKGYNPVMDPDFRVTQDIIKKTTDMRYQGVGGNHIDTKTAFAMQKNTPAQQSVESVSPKKTYSMANVVTKIQEVSNDKDFRKGNEGFRTRRMVNALAGMGLDPTIIEGFKKHVNSRLIQSGTPGTLNSTIRPANVIRFAENEIGKRTFSNKAHRLVQRFSPISV
jgi:hypothetical protein